MTKHESKLQFFPQTQLKTVSASTDLPASFQYLHIPPSNAQDVCTLEFRYLVTYSLLVLLTGFLYLHMLSST